jgi:hypothetical protein
MSCECCTPLGPGPSPGGSIEPLSLLLVVDPSGGSGTQDGAFTEPQTFSTLAAAIAAATTGSTLLLMPADYTVEGTLSWVDKILNFVGIGYEQEATQLPELDCTGPACAVRVENCQTLVISCPTGPVHIERGLLSGEVIAATSTLLETRSSLGAALTSGTCRTDLYSFNAFGRVNGVLTGGPFDIVDSRVFNYEFYCELTAYPYGNGSQGAPFATLREAVDTAPTRDISAAKIRLGMGDWDDGAPIPYTDKRLSIEGTFILNESPDPPTHGVFLQPLSSDDSNLSVEIIRTNSNVSAKSQGIIILMQDGHCEQIGDGTHFSTMQGCGSSALPNRVATSGTQQSGVTGTGLGLLDCIYGYAVVTAGIVFTAQVLTNAAVTSQFTVFDIRASITASGPLEIYDSVFNNAAGAVMTGSVVRTDLATYSRGVTAGVTWPANTEIVDRNVQLQPYIAAFGVGSNSNGGSPTPAYGTNLVGDRFSLFVNQDGGAAPTAPAGWTLRNGSTSGGLISRTFTRDAPSTGGEAGTITVTGGGGLCQALIASWRNATQATNFVESLANSAQGDGATNPTVANAPTVTAVGAGRTACCMFGSNDPNPPTTIAGQTGGTWVNKADFQSGLGANINVQTAALANAGTVTGGTASVPGTRVNVLGFAVIGVVT